MGLGISIAKHGEPDTYNGWASLIGFLLAHILLYFGGFYDKL